MKLKKTVEKIIQRQRVFQDSKRDFSENGIKRIDYRCLAGTNIVDNMQSQKKNIWEGEAQ